MERRVRGETYVLSITQISMIYGTGFSYVHVANRMLNLNWYFLQSSPYR